MTLTAAGQQRAPVEGFDGRSELVAGSERAAAVSAAGVEARRRKRERTEVDMAKQALRLLLEQVITGQAPVTAQSFPMLVRAVTDVIKLDQADQVGVSTNALAARLAELSGQLRGASHPTAVDIIDTGDAGHDATDRAASPTS